MEQNQFNEASAKIGAASVSILREGDQSWRLEDATSSARHALQEQARKWGIIPEMPLQHDSCDDASLAEQKDKIVGCNWYSGDGTQQFWVSLQKPKSTKRNAVGRDIPWVVTSISATICH